jgi:UDP-N-acetylmuramoyl-tripeptide--D-alanyl-D-alanine ligase
VNLRRLGLWAQETLFWRPVSRYRVLRYPVAALAFAWRRLLFRTTFIAITGSLGKTTAKECLAAALGEHFRTIKSSGNRNAGLGLFVSVLRVRPWHRFAVLEVAGAVPDNMRRLAWVVRPDVAVILNVLRTHTTSFPTLDDHAEEKARLLDAVRGGGLALLNADDPRIAPMADRNGLRVRRFGTSPSFDVWADQVSGQWPERLVFRAHAGAESHAVVTQLVGTHWLAAVLAAVATARYCGVPLRGAAEAMRRVEPFPARLQPVQLPIGAIVLRDDYNAAIDTLDVACRVLEEARAGRRLFVVNDFSDFGRNRKNRLRYLAEKAARSAEVALFIGENAAYGQRRAIQAGMLPRDVHACPSFEAAARFLRTELRPGDLVLLKGRTTDHAARIFFAQLGDVGCWKVYCSKRTLCDNCWELGSRPEDATRAAPPGVPAGAGGA